MKIRWQFEKIETWLIAAALNNYPKDVVWSWTMREWREFNKKLTRRPK